MSPGLAHAEPRALSGSPQPVTTSSSFLCGRRVTHAGGRLRTCFLLDHLQWEPFRSHRKNPVLQLYCLILEQELFVRGFW